MFAPRSFKKRNYTGIYWEDIIFVMLLLRRSMEFLNHGQSGGGTDIVIFMLCCDRYIVFSAETFQNNLGTVVNVILSKL